MEMHCIRHQQAYAQELMDVCFILLALFKKFVHLKSPFCWISNAVANECIKQRVGGLR